VRYRPMTSSQQPATAYVVSCDGQMHAVSLPQTYTVIPAHTVSLLPTFRHANVKRISAKFLTVYLHYSRKLSNCSDGPKFTPLHKSQSYSSNCIVHEPCSLPIGLHKYISYRSKQLTRKHFL